MEHRTSYTCSPCGAVSGVTVSDLPDPAHDYSPGLRKAIADHDMALRVLDNSAQSELRYATCPRCGARNPEGIEASAKELRSMRVGGGTACALLALGTWFFPGLAWLVVVIVVALTVLVVFAAFRAPATERPWRSVLTSLAWCAAVLGIALWVPRANALLPLLLAVQYARTKKSDVAFERAKTKLRFDRPYR